MSRYLKLTFMVAAEIAGVHGNLSTAMVAMTMSLVCAGYPVVKTGGWK